ncbi:MAG: hypothetical protein PHO08_09525 [Methylococcales bacterium]|nr:hypothetical protein [Methylococcales bacterium]MDD5632213.1 hypothetical protein [Methylococcales bacterium]
MPFMRRNTAIAYCALWIAPYALTPLIRSLCPHCNKVVKDNLCLSCGAIRLLRLTGLQFHAIFYEKAVTH